MIHFTKGGIENLVAQFYLNELSFLQEGQRPLSPESDLTILLTAEDTDEDQVNPRGSRDCSYAVHFGLG
jgi:hypothetical protein